MEFSIALPGDTSTTRAGREWAEMKQRLSAHSCQTSCSSSGASIPGMPASSFLAQVAGQHILDITRECAMDEKEASRFKRALYLLEDKCVPFLLILYNRFKFFTCRQKSLRTGNSVLGVLSSLSNKKSLSSAVLHNPSELKTESVPSQEFDSFYEELNIWMENCEFEGQNDNLLKACIIQGMKDEAVRHRLLCTEGLDLSKTLQICRAVERSNKIRDCGVNTDIVEPCPSQDASAMEESVTRVGTDRIENSAETEDLKIELDCIGISKGWDKVLEKGASPADFEPCDDFDDDDDDETVVNGDCPSLDLELSPDYPLVKMELSTDSQLSWKESMPYTATNDDSERGVHEGTTVPSKVPIESDCSSMKISETPRGVKDTTTKQTSLLSRKQKGNKKTVLSKLNRHVLLHTGKKQYSCDTCGKSFSDPSRLQQHCQLTQHETVTAHITSVFSGPSDSEKHLVGTQQNGIKTDSSENKITTEDTLTDTPQERPFVCGKCGATFGRSNHLREHVQLHTENRPYMCHVCGAKFYVASKLKSHLRKHTGEKPYVCQYCGASFTWSAALTRHKRTHTKEKPYNCSTCGRDFADYSTLQRHVRRHTGEKPFPCNQCDSAFADSSSLIRHRKSVHEGQKLYTCDICGAGFAVKSYLARHKRIHSDYKPFTCDICGASFIENGKLKRHLKIHTRVPKERGRKKKSLDHLEPPDSQLVTSSVKKALKTKLGKKHQQPQ